MATKHVDDSLDRLRLQPRRRYGVARLVALVALLAFFGAILVIVVASMRRHESTAASTTTRRVTPPPAAQRPTPKPQAPAARPLALAGAQAYDPAGDGVENDGEVGFAIDRNLATFWSTEHYTNFSKPGVGLTIDLGRTAQVQQVRLATDTPGYRARIEVGSSARGPFRTVAADREVTGATVFSVQKPVRARYVTVWITAIPPQSEAHVNEVRITGR
jgi:hypothetical protein